MGRSGVRRDDSIAQSESEPAISFSRRRRLLLVAFHFPPLQGSTGTIRAVAFSRYLRRYGWDCCVLTIDPGAYESVESQNESLVARHVRVERAWGLDAKRHLSIRGKYVRALAVPDRWQSWILGGYRRGLRILKRWNPDVIMSTYPIPSAHVIGHLLQRKSRLPWVAEFRDPMLQQTFPRHKWERRSFAKIEETAILHSREIIVTTEGCKRFYLDRYTDLVEKNISVISNGYDPEAFAGLRRQVSSESDRTVLLHSGLLYPHERNPAWFFDAVKRLDDEGFFYNRPVQFRFRGSGNIEGYSSEVRSRGLQELISILPPLPYKQALEEMLTVEGLMLFQARSCNDQIPAKVYEYLYCRKPIVAFTDKVGETGQLLLSLGNQNLAPLDDRLGIVNLLKIFLEQLRQGNAFVVGKPEVQRFSRQTLAADLAQVLNRAMAK